MGPKIATCCYCGTRAALKLSGEVQHELACSSCGAPLHEIKQMPVRSRKPEKKQHYEKPVSYKKPLKSKKKYKIIKDLEKPLFTILQDSNLSVFDHSLIEIYIVHYPHPPNDVLLKKKKILNKN